MATTQLCMVRSRAASERRKRSSLCEQLRVTGLIWFFVQVQKVTTPKSPRTQLLFATGFYSGAGQDAWRRSTDATLFLEIGHSYFGGRAWRQRRGCAECDDN